MSECETKNKKKYMSYNISTMFKDNLFIYSEKCPYSVNALSYIKTNKVDGKFLLIEMKKNKELFVQIKSHLENNGGTQLVSVPLVIPKETTILHVGDEEIGKFVDSLLEEDDKTFLASKNIKSVQNEKMSNIDDELKKRNRAYEDMRKKTMR
jgi:hypothetical protein